MLFIMCLTLGSIMALSSSNWLFVWMGLELNLLAFIPIMTTSTHLQETESAVKYFITQAIGSGLLLMSAMVIQSIKLYYINTNIMTTMLILSLIMKLGAAPLHWWLPQVMSGLNWTNCMILATWQKLAPLFLMSMIHATYTYIIMMMASISALVGGIGGLNQSHLRSLIAYSSIGHLGWMIAAASLSIYNLTTYFTIYCIINIAIMSSMSFITKFKMMMKNNIYSPPKTMTLMLSFMLMSLGGLPPLTGFIPKWIMFINMMKEYIMWPMIMLIMGSLMNLFFYLNMTFNILLTPQNKLNFSKLNTPTLVVAATLTSTVSSPVIMMSL
uniref:NADH dehydrogenase subunit 2 n=1 Tax=Tylorrhynchus heterochetus TaxID=3228785 RepID=UPI0005CFD069|nr:NADH dehydrogenase subunit 2 [Tylorrhynchus heterochaetus]